ncbi:hypothetical protein SAMN05216241_102278 [Limimonas halophila]|uniref:Peptidase propeptide and YPEB domain-containing protein n=1 Tax=Limimonas halophila TaxID=1082479 RepID=A0A1G7NRW9_9PROT|nr:hypothetical protein [Limimonas halophila]SDF76713.1 hypothetical protein SAMN05216241_102278 [Limimonas halophila]
MHAQDADAAPACRSLTESAIRESVKQRFRAAKLPYFRIKEIELVDDQVARVHLVGQSGATALWLTVDRITGHIRQYR